MLKLIDHTEEGCSIENSAGQRYFLKMETMRDIAVIFLLETLKADIEFDMDEMDGDYINLSNLTAEQIAEYQNDVYLAFEERIREELISPSNEDIWDEILAQARDYGAEV